MKRSTPPTTPSDLIKLSQGDWYHLSRRQKQELLNQNVRTELDRARWLKGI